MRWRLWLLSLCALGLLLTLANAVANMTVFGPLGLSGTPTPVAFVDRLVVQPGSAAAQSGIQTGDLLDWHRLSPAVRSRIYYGPRVGEPLALLIVRNGAERAVTVVSNSASGFNWTDWLFFAGQIWIVLCCMLIASRRAGDPEARLLIFYLLGVFVISQGFGNVITPWPVVDQLALIGSSGHTDATSVDLVRRYDANDPAMVRLSANPQALDMHTVETELHGDIAFPITARGQLLGVVVLGARRSGETYAPTKRRQSRNSRRVWEPSSTPSQRKTAGTAAWNTSSLQSTLSATGSKPSATRSASVYNALERCAGGAPNRASLATYRDKRLA